MASEPADSTMQESNRGSSSNSSTASSKNSMNPDSWKRPAILRKNSLLRHRSNASSKISLAKKRRPSRHAKFEDEKESEERFEFHSGLERQLTTKLPLRERVRHFTWTWFTMTMATGGIANVLYTIPIELRFPHLYALGCTFFILNIILFFFNITMISIRFYLYPHTFRHSFLHPTESLFIPAAVISLGTIFINITQYGVGTAGEWLENTMVVLYWMYCGLALSFSSGIYLIMWSTQTFTIAKMTPVWIFPAYPLLIIGPHAGNLAAKLPPEKALPIIIGGYILQGVGFMVSLMIYSAFLYRLMTQKLPKESLRPAMFISVGPSGFTISGLIQMGRQMPRVVNKDFMGEGMGELAGKVSMIMSNWAGMWLWGLAIWFFLVSVGAHFSCAARGRMDFAMTWYSFVFPNTALTTSTFAISYALHGNLATAPHFSRGARPFQILGLIMTAGLIMTWFFVFFMMIRAVLLKQILWPQKQEDRDEGGWGKDEIVRKGEVKSVLQSRTTSETQLRALDGELTRVPTLLITPAGEGPSQGFTVDATQIPTVLRDPEGVTLSSTGDIQIEDKADFETMAQKGDGGGLFLKTKRRVREEKKVTTEVAQKEEV